MNFEEALDTIEEAMLLNVGRRLSEVEVSVLQGSWHKQTYDAIADKTHYSVNYLKIHVGPALWKTLSAVVEEPVTKNNIRSVLERRWRNSVKIEDRNKELIKPVGEIVEETFSSPPFSFYADWGEATDVSVFYGRTAELDTLTQWSISERCRLVALLGMGGIGKTALSIKLAHHLLHTSAQSGKTEFQFVIWRSLRNAPPLEMLLKELISFLSQQQDTQSSLSALIHYLRSFRCLVVLDNFETILQGGDCVGRFRAGYEDYGELLRLVGESDHQSCTILTSREKPAEIATFEGMALKVRSLLLTGSPEAAQSLLQTKALVGSQEQKELLCDRYGNSPLALKIVASSVQAIFNYNIEAFLAEDTFVFNGIQRLLEQQFCRLSPLELSVMYWLAIKREPTTFAELHEDIVPTVSKAKLLEALESLQWRSLIESSASSFTLQPVVMEFVTEQQLECICRELETQELSLFVSHPLIEARAKDYIRESQIRLILAPIAQRLIGQFRSTKEVEYRLKEILFNLRSQFPNTVGYAGGNIINLLRQLQVDLSDCNFSYLNIRQANLQDLDLHRVNFSHSEFVKSTFTQTFGSILSVALSPDDRLLAATGANEDIHLWQVLDGQPFLILKGHKNWVLSVAFSPDSQLLASGGEDCQIKLWNLSDGNCLTTLLGHADYVHSVSFSPNGEVLASSSIDRTVKIWSVSTGECLKTLHGHEGWIERVIFSANGQMLASGSSDRTVKLWDAITGECIQTFYGHCDQVSAVAFSPDDQLLASCSGDLTIKLWQVDTGECLSTLEGHSGQVWSIAFSSDGTLLASGSHDRTIKLWNISTGQCVRTLQGHASQVRSIAFDSHSAMLASGSGDQTIRFWDVQSGQCIKTFQGYSSRIWSIAFNTDGTLLASGSYDRTIRVWDVSNGNCFRTLRGHSSWVRSVTFSPDGQILASGSGDQTVKLWNTTSMECFQTLHGHGSWIRSITFSPDGAILASASHDRTIRLWNLETYQCDRILSVNTVWTRAIAFAPLSNSDDHFLIGCLDENILGLWHVNTGQLLTTFAGHTAQIWSVVFSPDGQTLASSSRDRTVKLWDVATGQCLKTLLGHTRDVCSVAFSADKLSLATGGDDHTARVWDVNTGECTAIFSGHQGSVQSVVYSPDSLTLASGSEDETIRIWDIKTARCLKILRADRPYEGMNIAGVTGMAEAQKLTLKQLGGVEYDRS